MAALVQSNISAQLTADVPVWSIQLEAAGSACGEGVIGFQRTGSSHDCPTPPPSQSTLDFLAPVVVLCVVQLSGP